ncbi:MAG: hypothetical protein LBS43_04305 [Prevotellaceae bacterium]|jgi:hypothetical protein|nr:hypothetical protein [Prevotellaceae bacterium]
METDDKNIMETDDKNVLRTDEESDAIMNKILTGLEISYRKLLDYKKRNNQELVIMKDDKIISVKPEDLELF